MAFQNYTSAVFLAYKCASAFTLV